MDNAAPSSPRAFSFIGGTDGPWRVSSVRAVAGTPLALPAAVDVRSGFIELPASAAWVLHGATSHERYTTGPERTALQQHQQGLGRPTARCAALIPIRKNAAWWALAQDERRGVMEAQSQHIAIGMRYLPAIARRLHHCRDTGRDAPFDFITWFEFASGDTPAFDALLQALRASPEWVFVDRECDIRLEAQSRV